MNSIRVFVTSLGIISPLGHCVPDTLDAIKKAIIGITPLTLFQTPTNQPLPVGEIKQFPGTEEIPRTHALALMAAKEALKNADGIPDAIVIGVTTGGLPTTEELLKNNVLDPQCYKYHANGSVAEYLARQLKCHGPVITVSTACSSSMVALKVALEMLRCNKAKRILVGGVDALCRLTYYGFHSLQLVDPIGARPFDRDRRGMTVAEGAAMLFLTASETQPVNALAELLAVGLSCDAYHPAAPHPNGDGALKAMQNACTEAGISVSDIDYINLHGTGTIDNDLSEAKAIHSLFGKQPLPPLSSIKGACGHSLGAAGAMATAITVLSIAEGIIPANTGFHTPDPALNMHPVHEPVYKNITVALSNAFGFGGNNASLVVSQPKKIVTNSVSSHIAKPVSFTVLGCACATGAGDLEQTIQQLRCGNGCRGLVQPQALMHKISESDVRRLKRLSRMVLSLAVAACENAALAKPSAIFLGTGWGGLSETHDFLKKLFESGEHFTSPTDFIGSVHNAAAGHVAIRFKSTGPNLALTGGDYSFEQAVFCASLISRNSDEPIIVIGADEFHQKLSPLFDPSVALEPFHTDGGGALCLSANKEVLGIKIVPSFFTYAHNNSDTIPILIKALGGSKRIKEQFGAILAGIPAAQNDTGKKQLDVFQSMSGFTCPVIDYRKFIGEFAAASAVATIVAIQFVKADDIPLSLFHKNSMPLEGKGILVLGFGDFVTAVEILPG